MEYYSGKTIQAIETKVGSIGKLLHEEMHQIAGDVKQVNDKVDFLEHNGHQGHIIQGCFRQYCLDGSHQWTLNILHQIKLPRLQLSMLINWNTNKTSSIINKLNYEKQRPFAFTNKPGRWLAYKLRKEREKTLEKLRRVIILILKNPLKISILTCIRKKKQAYKNRWLFAKATFTKLSQAQRQLMNDPISTFEISDPFKKMETGQAPGPNGLSSQYYKFLSSKWMF